jgi:hypothetical protein
VDGPKFDDLTRALGQGRSRRTLLRGLAGGVAGLVAGAVARTNAGVAARELSICHATGDSNAPYQTLTIPQEEMNQHARHGDFLRVECCADGDCPNQYGACGRGTCQTGYCVQLPIAAGTACDPGQSGVTGGVCDGAYTCTASDAPVVCPEGRVALVNGSCAVPCPGGEGCNVCSANRCISTSDGLVCSVGGSGLRCSSNNADCPVGQACSGAFCENLC